MKKQLKGKQSFYDDKQRENVVSYYLMEDQEQLVDRVIHNLIKYKVTPISLAESLDEIMTREEEDGRSKI